MRDGFIKVAAGTPQIRVADCRYNAEQIFTLMREADKQGVRVLALPELCLTGYTCGDLFLQDTLLRGAEEGLATILEATKHLDLLAAVGAARAAPEQLYELRRRAPPGGDSGPGTQDLPAQLRGSSTRSAGLSLPARRPPILLLRAGGLSGLRRDLPLREHARPHCGGGDL